MVKRKTVGKRMVTKLKDIKAKLQERMHESTADTLKWLQSVVKGVFPTDERGWETGRRFGVSARAHPRLYTLRGGTPPGGGLSGTCPISSPVGRRLRLFQWGRRSGSFPTTC